MKNVIIIAAHNSPEEDKRHANFICSGENDELVLNRAVELLPQGGTIRLLDGDYNIDGFPHEERSAVVFGYNDGQARTITIEGVTENKGYNTRFGAVIHVTRRAMDSLRPGEAANVFYATAQRPESRGDYFTMTYVNNVNFRNFELLFSDAQHPVAGLNCHNAGSMYVELVGIFSKQYFDDRYMHWKPATAHEGTVGVLGPHGSNDEMARIGFQNLTVGGLYMGIHLDGTDHVVLQCCSTARCCYGYVFEKSAKTLTMINCDDEGNTHLPLLRGRGQLTCIDFNIERFNAAYIPDDPTGYDEPFMEEEIPGGWHGFISYTMQGKAFGLNRLWKQGHGVNFRTVNLYHAINARPADPEYLETYFDPESRKTYTWTGEMWVDAMGNPA